MARRCRTRAEASAAIAAAPRAAAHTYWLADSDGAEVLECTSHSAVRRACGGVDGEDVLVQTNHCLVPSHAADGEERPSKSSLARLARGRAALAAPRGPRVIASDVVRLFADRSDGAASVCRWPEDGTGTTTNACVLVEPAARRVHACRGSADRGAWITHTFEDGAPLRSAL